MSKEIFPFEKNSQDVLQLFVDDQHLKYEPPVKYFVVNDQYRNLEKTNWRSSKLEIQFDPGTQYGYSGEGVVYLGKVIEHLTGKGK